LDEYRRVCSKAGSVSNKAKKTIEICKIEKLNAARLADYFVWGKNVRNKKRWEELYASLYSEDKAYAKKRAEFFELLANSGTDPVAQKLHKQLSDELPTNVT